MELFSLGVMVKALRAIIDWKSLFLKVDGSLWSKILGRRGHAPPTILRHSQKTRYIDLSFCVRIWPKVSYCNNSHVWQTHGRTDGQMLMARPRLHTREHLRSFCESVFVLLRHGFCMQLVPLLLRGWCNDRFTECDAFACSIVAIRRSAVLLRDTAVIFQLRIFNSILTSDLLHSA